MPPSPQTKPQQPLPIASPSLSSSQATYQWQWIVPSVALALGGIGLNIRAIYNAVRTHRNNKTSHTARWQAALGTLALIAAGGLAWHTAKSPS